MIHVASVVANSLHQVDRSPHLIVSHDPTLRSHYLQSLSSRLIVDHNNKTVVIEQCSDGCRECQKGFYEAVV